jgi:hypothetical protein
LSTERSRFESRGRQLCGQGKHRLDKPSCKHGQRGKFGTNTFSTVQADINDIGANYNAMQLSLERRVSHGLTVSANYTYSKSLDDLPFGEGV